MGIEGWRSVGSVLVSLFGVLSLGLSSKCRFETLVQQEERTLVRGGWVGGYCDWEIEYWGLSRGPIEQTLKKTRCV